MQVRERFNDTCQAYSSRIASSVRSTLYATNHYYRQLTYNDAALKAYDLDQKIGGLTEPSDGLFGRLWLFQSVGNEALKTAQENKQFSNLVVDLKSRQCPFIVENEDDWNSLSSYVFTKLQKELKVTERNALYGWERIAAYVSAPLIGVAPPFEI